MDYLPPSKLRAGSRKFSREEERKEDRAVTTVAWHQVAKSPLGFWSRIGQ